MYDSLSFYVQVKKEVGDVNILINNAGIVSGKKFIESLDSRMQKTMEVNAMAHFWVTLKKIFKDKLTNTKRRMWVVAVEGRVIFVLFEWEPRFPPRSPIGNWTLVCSCETTLSNWWHICKPLV